MKYLVNNKKATWRIVGDEAVIINTETRIYYNLNETGTFIWRLLAKSPLPTEEITGKLAERYEKKKDKIANDVKRVLSDLKNEGLIIGS